MQRFMSFLAAFWPHLLFIILNTIIVAANIIMPRFLDRSEIAIISADGLIDESETEIGRVSSFIVSEIVEYTDKGNAYFANSRCFSALKVNRLVPNSCRQLAIDTATEVISSSVAERDLKLKALQNIDQYDREKLIEALESTNPFYYRSSLYSEVFFNFLAVDTFADPAISTQIKDSLLEAASGLVNKEYAYIDTFEDFKSMLEQSNKDLVRSGRMAFRVIISNSGHADDIIFPEAKLEIAGETINLVQILESNINEPASGVANNFTFIEIGKVASLYFAVEPAINTERANKLISDIARQATPLPFKLTVLTKSGPVSTESVLAVDSISFELEFANKGAAEGS